MRKGCTRLPHTELVAHKYWSHRRTWLRRLQEWLGWVGTWSEIEKLLTGSRQNDSMAREKMRKLKLSKTRKWHWRKRRKTETGWKKKTEEIEQEKGGKPVNLTESTHLDSVKRMCSKKYVLISDSYNSLRKLTRKSWCTTILHCNTSSHYICLFHKSFNFDYCTHKNWKMWFNLNHKQLSPAQDLFSWQSALMGVRHNNEKWNLLASE